MVMDSGPDIGPEALLLYTMLFALDLETFFEWLTEPAPLARALVVFFATGFD